MHVYIIPCSSVCASAPTPPRSKIGPRPMHGTMASLRHSSNFLIAQLAGTGAHCPSQGPYHPHLSAFQASNFEPRALLDPRYAISENKYKGYGCDARLWYRSGPRPYFNQSLSVMNERRHSVLLCAFFDQIHEYTIKYTNSNFKIRSRFSAQGL